ncbi:hypothetical protein SKAU_G00151350 [Synaphobranchus kaupii]|uniref:Uncharacterized protein n=1 Tax=Synaphobranchus kaupii TaxID=118154 RepID=A0A9Q1FH91_SYNKA|nr:hypothetical protein SKAU_G00151350 [Synaphobranchus kaupii]
MQQSVSSRWDLEIGSDSPTVSKINLGTHTGKSDDRLGLPWILQEDTVGRRFTEGFLFNQRSKGEAVPRDCGSYLLHLE